MSDQSVDYPPVGYQMDGVYQSPYQYPADQYDPTVYQDPDTGVTYQMAPVYATPYPVIVYAPQPQTNGFATAGMVMGIVSLCGFLSTVVLPIAGLILSLIGRNKAIESGSNAGQAIAGIVCNSLALLLMIFIIIIYLSSLGFG